MAKAGCDRDTNYLKYELEIERKKNKLIYNAQKEEIETLRELAKGSDNTFWTTIGFVLGAGMSIAIFMHQLKSQNERQRRQLSNKD